MSYQPRKKKRTKASSSTSKSSKQSSNIRLSDHTWNIVLSYSLSDISLRFDTCDDLSNCIQLRNMTLVNKSFNLDCNSDVLWKQVWTDWKESRNKFWIAAYKRRQETGSSWQSLPRAPSQLKTIDGKNGTDPGTDPASLYYVSHIKYSSTYSNGIRTYVNNAKMFNLSLAPPVLRARANKQTLLASNDIVLSKKGLVSKGFAAAFRATLASSCAHCRIIPLEPNVAKLQYLNGDELVTTQSVKCIQLNMTNVIHFFKLFFCKHIHPHHAPSIMPSAYRKSCTNAASCPR